MGLFNYLTTSEIRRTLLLLLWREQLEASIHQFAKLSGFAYSAIYKELEEMKREGLVDSERRGKADHFFRNRDYESAHVLIRLLGGSKPAVKRRISDQDIIANLVRLGAPLAVTAESTIELLPEEAAIKGLELSRRNAVVARVLPIFLAINEKNFDFKKLFFMAAQNKLKPILGFFLDLTGTIGGHSKFLNLAKQLKDNRCKKHVLFFLTAHPTELQYKLSEMNTPVVAKRWNFLMNMGLDSFESIFKRNIKEVL